MHDKRNLAQLLVTKLLKVTNNKYTFYTQYQTACFTLCSAQVSRPLVTQLLVLCLLLLLLTEHVSPTTTTYSTGTTNTGARAAVFSVGKVQVMRAVSATTDVATIRKALMLELRMM